MNPKLVWIAGLALVAAVAVVAAQAAQIGSAEAMPLAESGMGGMMAMHQEMHGADGAAVGHMGGMGAHMGKMHGMGAMHAQMTEVFEGTYDDLVQKRTGTGLNLAPMIQSAEDFEVMKRHHALMEKYREEGGLGCPMMGNMGESLDTQSQNP